MFQVRLHFWPKQVDFKKWKKIFLSKSQLIILHYIKPKGLTLRTFAKYTEGGSAELANCIYGCIEKYNAAKLISDMPNDVLVEIASHLSLKERQKYQELQFTWKDVAGKVGLKDFEIAALDSEYRRAVKRSSMTTEFISYLKARYPDYRVVSIMNGLRGIGRMDVIEECQMFLGCKKKYYCQ